MGYYVLVVFFSQTTVLFLDHTELISFRKLKIVANRLHFLVVQYQERVTGYPWDGGEIDN